MTNEPRFMVYVNLGEGPICTPALRKNLGLLFKETLLTLFLPSAGRLYVTD